jgi:hypothetical protein
MNGRIKSPRTATYPLPGSSQSERSGTQSREQKSIGSYSEVKNVVNRHEVADAPIAFRAPSNLRVPVKAVAKNISVEEQVKVSSPPEPVKVSSPRISPRISPPEPVKVSSPRIVPEQVKVSSPRISPRISPPEPVKVSSPRISPRISPPEQVKVSSPPEQVKVSSPPEQVKVSSPRISPPEQVKVSSPPEQVKVSSPPEQVKVSSPRISPRIESTTTLPSTAYTVHIESKSEDQIIERQSSSTKTQAHRPKFVVPAVPTVHSSGGITNSTISTMSSTKDCASIRDLRSVGDTKTRSMKSKAKGTKKTKQQKLYEQYNVPKGQQLVKAGDRYYVVKKYHKMTIEEQELERTEMEMDYRNLNRCWNRQGMHFKLPEEGESLAHISVRLQQYRRFVKSRMGSDSHKIMLIFGWVLTEGLLSSLSIPANGYVEGQIAMFDLYQNRLIEMGEMGGGFGQDWSPMTWILVMSVVNAAVVVGMNKFYGGEGAQQAMRGITSLIAGNNIAVGTNGTPLPPEQQPAAPNPVGDIMNSFMGGDPNTPNAAFDFIGKLAPMFFSRFTGGRVAAAKKPRARRGPTFK